MQTLSPIDMFTPLQTCHELGIDEDTLIDMVNQGHLAAYNIGGQIRFKILDVVAAMALMAVA